VDYSDSLTEKEWLKVNCNLFSAYDQIGTSIYVTLSLGFILCMYMTGIKLELIKYIQCHSCTCTSTTLLTVLTASYKLYH
jgi:uncharacterized membrane protein YdbT with pleckstrin-like domain